MCKKLLFFIIAIILQVVLLIKCPIYFLRLYLPAKFCSQNNGTLHNDSNTIFTVVIYGLLFLGRFIEALIIEIYIYKFMFKQSSVTDIKGKFYEKLKENKCLSGLIILSVIWMIINSLAVLAMGIAHEIMQDKVSNCISIYSQRYNVIYWFLDIVRYIYDIVIRIFMIMATMAIGIIWSKKEANITINNEAPTDNEASMEGFLLILKEKEPLRYVNYLEDRNNVISNHKLQMDSYNKKGNEVKTINAIFQAWFVIPWILFFIQSTLLDSKVFLKAWQEQTKTKPEFDFLDITFLVYNINQLVLLILPYMCSKIINAYHQKYLALIRKNQLTRYQTASKMALACIQKIEKNRHYNFTPHIWGTTNKIKIENPMYYIILLIGIFITLSDTLLVFPYSTSPICKIVK